MKLAWAQAAALLLAAAAADAQTFTQRGYVEGQLLLYPQEGQTDPQRGVGDVLVREELFARPVAWLQVAAGADLRANSHEQVEDAWRLDWADRGVRRPRLAVRRLAATVTRGPLTVDAGKQFIRWGTTDIITPTDRFSPRDFLNVITSEFLPVVGARVTCGIAGDTFEGVWLPRMTPSRVPLFDQRWTVVPPEAAGFTVVDRGSEIPAGSQVGVRWRHVAGGFEMALSYFDGFNHLPNIASTVEASPPTIILRREYPRIRAFGADGALPTRWFTAKAEAEYFTDAARSPERMQQRSDDYILYVIQFERQSGEWVFVGGYAGEYVTTSRGSLVFAPDRGLARSFVGRAAYTIDPRRSLAVEGTVRRRGDGLYGKLEYSEARGRHWRATLAAVVISGHRDDFLGQYRRNSHVGVALRYSF